MVVNVVKGDDGGQMCVLSVCKLAAFLTGGEKLHVTKLRNQWWFRS